MFFAILFSVLTTLSEGMFHTSYEEEANATVEACNVVVDSLISNLQTDPQLLSDWAFAGLGRQDNPKRNAVYLVWKHSEYYPERQYSKLVLDVLINDKPMFKDVVMESQVTDTMIDGIRDIRVDIYYSGSLLKQAYGIFHVIPTGENTAKIGIETHIKFGWFFRIFITRRVYSETIDWRLIRFIQNLKLTAEGNRPTDAYWDGIEPTFVYE